MRELTAKQIEVLDTIRFFVEANGYPPTIRELQPLLGLTSNRGVTVHLDALEAKGHIRRGMNPRGIQLLKSDAGTDIVCVYIPRWLLKKFELDAMELSVNR